MMLARSEKHVSGKSGSSERSDKPFCSFHANKIEINFWGSLGWIVWVCLRFFIVADFNLPTFLRIKGSGSTAFFFDNTSWSFSCWIGSIASRSRWQELILDRSENTARYFFTGISIDQWLSLEGLIISSIFSQIILILIDCECSTGNTVPSRHFSVFINHWNIRSSVSIS